MTDRFSRICLLAVVALLAVIAFKPSAERSRVHAATKSQYMAVEVDPANLKHYSETLAKYTNDGWEVVAAPTYQRSGESWLRLGILVLRK